MDDFQQPGTDPGWGLDRRAMMILVPGLNARYFRSLKGDLRAIRGIFVTFVISMLMVGVVVLFLWQSGDGQPDGGMDATVTVLLVLLVGLAGQVAAQRVPPPLPGDDAGQLVAAYRVRFFLRVAFSESAALIGFVGFFLSGNPVSYLAGLAVALVGFVRLAPTRAHLEWEDEAMRARGCPHTIYQALLSAS
jgi:hypothetical protein